MTKKSNNRKLYIISKCSTMISYMNSSNLIIFMFIVSEINLSPNLIHQEKE